MKKGIMLFLLPGVLLAQGQGGMSMGLSLQSSEGLNSAVAYGLTAPLWAISPDFKIGFTENVGLAIGFHFGMGNDKLTIGDAYDKFNYTELGFAVATEFYHYKKKNFALYTGLGLNFIRTSATTRDQDDTKDTELPSINTFGMLLKLGAETLFNQMVGFAGEVGTTLGPSSGEAEDIDTKFNALGATIPYLKMGFRFHFGG